MQLVCSSFVFLINKHCIVFHQLERNKGVTEQSEMESIIYSKSCMYMLFFCPPTDTKSVIPVLKSRRKNTTSLSSLKDLVFSNSSSDFFSSKPEVTYMYTIFFILSFFGFNHEPSLNQCWQCTKLEKTQTPSTVTLIVTGKLQQTEVMCFCSFWRLFQLLVAQEKTARACRLNLWRIVMISAYHYNSNKLKSN